MNKSKAFKGAHFNTSSRAANEKISFIYIHDRSVKSQQALVSRVVAVTGAANQRDLHSITKTVSF